MTLTITIDFNAQPADIMRELHRVAALVAVAVRHGNPYALDNVALVDELGEIGRTEVTE